MPRSRRQNSNSTQDHLPSPDQIFGLKDKMVCDDCGEPAQIIVSELITRGVDVLCWSCQMARVTAVVTTIMQQEEQGEANDPGV